MAFETTLFGITTVSFDNVLISRRSPIDLEHLTRHLIGNGNPVSRPEWTFDVDRKTGKDVAQGVLERKTEDNCQDARRRQQRRDLLFEYSVQDADEGQDIDQGCCQIREQASRVRLVIVREDRPAKQQIKQVLDEPRPQNSTK